MIDIKAKREAYNEEIVNGILWIHRKCILADSMTKYGISTEVLDEIRSGKINYEVEQSITRRKATSSKEKRRSSVRIMINECSAPVIYHSNDAKVSTISHNCYATTGATVNAVTTQPGSHNAVC